MSRISPLIGCALLLLWGCGGSPPTAPSTVSASDLTLAPTSAVVGGKTISLETSLWRDFMPITAPGGNPMIVALHIKTADGSGVPPALRGDRVWLVNGTDVWSTVPKEEQPRQATSPVYELVARDGPKWDPGINVDVVVRLSSSERRVILLRAPRQPVRATF